MTFEDPAVSQARAATAALRELELSARQPTSDAVPPAARSTEVLDELSRLPTALAGAVEAACGGSAPDVVRLAAELSDAVLRRRDALTGGERPTSPVLPAVGHEAGRPGSPGPKHRAHRHLRPVR